MLDRLDGVTASTPPLLASVHVVRRRGRTHPVPGRLVNDDHIAQMVTDYRPGGSPPATVPADAVTHPPGPSGGGVVIDLADAATRPA